MKLALCVVTIFAGLNIAWTGDRLGVQLGQIAAGFEAPNQVSQAPAEFQKQNDQADTNTPVFDQTGGTR